VARETTGVGERLIMDDADEKPTVSIDPRYQLCGCGMYIGIFVKVATSL
jgi:hypothetical protein